MCDIFFIIAWVFKSQKVVASGYYDIKKCSQCAIQKMAILQQFRVFVSGAACNLDSQNCFK